MNVDVSPDGTTLVFDLLGDLYLLPIDGGRASPLTTGRAWDSSPRFSPDGRFVYFISDRDGVKNIWRHLLSEQSLSMVTDSDASIEGSLNWSQGGTQLLASARIAPEYVEWVPHFVDPDTGSMRAIARPSGPWIDRAANRIIRRPTKISSAVQSSDGQVYFSQSQYRSELDRLVVRLHTIDLTTGRHDILTPSGAPYSDYKPQLSHSGSNLAYLRQYSDRRTELRLRDRTTQQEQTIWTLDDAEDASYGASQDERPNYAFTPNDEHVILWHDGKIYRVTLDDGSTSTIPFRASIAQEVWERSQPIVQEIGDTGEARIVRWPSVSTDNQTMVFSAIGYVWVMDLATTRIRRLTDSSDFEYMPAISPDGKSVAYVSFAESEDDYWPGRLMVVELDGGVPRQVLGGANETFLLPNWSSDSQRVALIRERQLEDGTGASFGWTSVEDGTFHEVASAPASRDFFNRAVYARWVGFDDAGTSLIFSFQKPRPNATLTSETILAIAALDGSEQRTLAVGASEVAGITPSPDLTTLALTRSDESVWLVPFAAGSESVEVSVSESQARRLSDGAAYYVDWNDVGQVTFGFAQDVYRYRLDTDTREVMAIRIAYTIPKATQPIAFRGARLITLSGDHGAGAVIESGTLVVKGGRIAAIGPADEVAIPGNALIVDVRNKSIIPGLVDVHYHNIGGYGLSGLKLPNGNFNDRSALAYGITTAWEPGGSWSDGVPAAVDLQASGRIIGPRWSHAAQGRVGRRPWDSISTYPDALALIKRNRSLGVTLLKGPCGARNRQHRQWLSIAAHRQGLAMVCHLDNLEDMLTGIVDGHTGGEHSYISIPFFKDVREMLRQSGYIWTPQIVITNGSVSGGMGVGSYYWQQAIKKYPLALEKFEAIAPNRGVDPIRRVATRETIVPYCTHRVSRLARQVASAAKAGVHIGVSAHDKPGGVYLLQGEMWYLWKGGMPIEDVLRATTIGNAMKLGLQGEIGTLEPGKIADFLVLEANPLADILNTLSLKYTVQNGVVYDSSTGRVAEL